MADFKTVANVSEIHSGDMKLVKKPGDRWELGRACRRKLPRKTCKLHCKLVRICKCRGTTFVGELQHVAPVF